MHIIIDTILILLLLLIFLICGGELANALGGSLVFPIFIITTSLFSQIYKKYQIEVSAVGIILLTLLLTNFVDYLDKANKLQFIWIILIYCSVYFAGIAAFIFLALRPLLPIGDNANKAEFVELKMRIFARLSFFPLISLFVFCIPTAFPYFYLGLADRRFVDKDLVDGRLYGFGIISELHQDENPYGESNNYVSYYEAFFYADTVGTWHFATDSADASELEVDGQVVSSWYGEHTCSDDWSHNGSIELDTGWHRLVYRQEVKVNQGACRAAFKNPTDSNWRSLSTSELTIKALLILDSKLAKLRPFVVHNIAQITNVVSSCRHSHVKLLINSSHP